nr:hypothetical protein [Tanacetum cinerariifolium]
MDRDGEDMDIFAFIHNADPTNVKVVKREQQEDEPWLLETTIGRTVPLLPVAPDNGESELEASVDKLFDEGGSGTQAKQGEPPVSKEKKNRCCWCRSAVQRLLAGAMHNAEVRGEPIHTLPFVTSSVSATPEREGEDSSHHSGANIVEAEVDSFDRPFAPIITSATTITSTADPAVLFTEFNVGAARKMSFNAEVRMRAEYNIREKLRLKFVVEEKNQVLKARDEEIENLKAQLQLKEAKAAKAIRLRAETSKLETTEKSLRDEVTALNEHNIILEKERNALDVKETNLEPVVVSKERELTDSATQLTSIKSQNDNLADQVTLHLEERFYPHLLTTIAGRRWILTHGMELAIAKCLNSPEYLSAFGTAISKAIKKGMQDGLAAGITHGREGHVLTDVAAHNPTAEADTSIEAMMNILHLEEHLAERLGLNESQPHADQLMVLIHHSSDKIVIGAFALSLALDVSDARVWRIRENIMSHRSLFQDVFIPLAEPLSVVALTGMEDDYGVMGTDDQSVVNEKVVDKDPNPFLNVDDAELNIPQ